MVSKIPLDFFLDRTEYRHCLNTFGHRKHSGQEVTAASWVVGAASYGQQARKCEKESTALGGTNLNVVLLLL